MSGQGTDFLRDLGDAARRNPVSAALIGMGALWLFSGRGMGQTKQATRSNLGRATDTARDVLGGAGSVAKSGVASASETLHDGTSRVVRRAADLGRQQTETVSQYAKAIPDEAGEMIDSMQSALADLFQRRPLALGVIGVALGATIAAAIPSTETEAESLGKIADATKDRAQEFAAEQVQRVGEVAEKALDAAGEEARNQGLTMEGAKSAASEMSAKAERVLDAAKEGASAKTDAMR
jgi:hypothetical protein